MPLPKKNVAFSFDVSLVDSANRPQFRANPTLAAGDATVSIDEGAFANLATLPTVSPAAGRNVKVSLSAGEMNGDRICVVFRDVAGAEWDDVIIDINASANVIEDVIADTDDIQTRLPAALNGGRMDAHVGAMANSVLAAAAIASGAFSNGKFAADFPAKAILTGTCQAGSTGTTIVLSAGADANNDWYKDCHVQTTGGTGSGQQRHIISYNGTTKVATVSKTWITTPDATTTFAIVGDDSEWNTDRAGHAIAGSFGEGVIVSGGVTVTTNNDKTGYALTAAERNSIADAYLDRADAIETGLTPRQSMRLIVAADAGKLSGAGSSPILIRNAVADTKNRITATVDVDGNRSVIVYDLT